MNMGFSVSLGVCELLKGRNHVLLYLQHQRDYLAPRRCSVNQLGMNGIELRSEVQAGVTSLEYAGHFQG